MDKSGRFFLCMVAAADVVGALLGVVAGLVQLVTVKRQRSEENGVSGGCASRIGDAVTVVSALAAACLLIAMACSAAFCKTRLRPNHNGHDRRVLTKLTKFLSFACIFGFVGVYLIFQGAFSYKTNSANSYCVISYRGFVFIGAALCVVHALIAVFAVARIGEGDDDH